VSVRLFVGEPDELTGSYLQLFSRCFDAAAARQAIKDVLARIGRAFDSIIWPCGDLAGPQHAEGASGPANLRHVVKALDKTGGRAHARFIQKCAPSVHFRLRSTRVAS